MIAMSDSHTVAGFSEADFQGFLAPRQEPAWLTAHRNQMWQAFQEMPWPARNDEEWIRTDIRLFRLDQFQLPRGDEGVESHKAAAPAPLLAHNVSLAGETTAINSVAAHSQLAAKWKEKGVVFGSLDQIVAEHPELVRKWLFTKAVDPSYDRFAALHAACWSGGHFVYVPRNVTVDEPLHCYSAIAGGEIDFGHLLVVLEDGAQATVLTETASIGGETESGFHCGATEVIVGDNAHLRLVGLQNWGQGVWHFAHQKAVVGRDASLQWTIAAIGSRLSKVNQHVALAGPGAQCQVNGVLFTEAKQHISYHTLQHHEAPSTRSDFLYKAALQDKSRTVWRGMIKVDHDAQKTDGYQRNDNLMLSTTSRADSIPGLEIEADDVRCTHGSTTGKVDEELLFYCESRGLTRKEASRLIVAGFFQQISDRITIDSVRDALASAIAQRVREYQ
jgi:Fe-S cluster assembly protein SufD